MLVLVGGFVVERYQGVVVESQDRRQDHDGAQSERDALAAEQGAQARAGAPLPAGKEPGAGGHGRPDRKQEPAERAARAGAIDGVLIRRQDLLRDRPQGVPGWPPGEDQAGIPLDRQRVVERDRMPAGGQRALRDGIRLGREGRAVDRKLRLPLSVHREAVRPGLRHPQQAAPADPIRRHGVPREIAEPLLVPVEDIGCVDSLRDGEVDPGVDPMVHLCLDTSLPRDQIPREQST